MTDVPTPNLEDIIALREKGMSRKQMAEYYGVTLSRVKRWIVELKIPKAVRRFRKKAVGARFEEGLTLVEKARMMLGKRMSEDFRGYLLDGRPVRVDVLLRAAGLAIPDVPG